jgi:hypothetical protein
LAKTDLVDSFRTWINRVASGGARKVYFVVRTEVRLHCDVPLFFSSIIHLALGL